MAALLANINMFTLLFWSHPVLSTVPILGRNGAWSRAHWFGSYEVGATTPSDGFAWYSSMVPGVGDWFLPLLHQTGDAYVAQFRATNGTRSCLHVFVMTMLVQPCLLEVLD